jgi:hypothetical protein
LQALQTLPALREAVLSGDGEGHVTAALRRTWQAQLENGGLSGDELFQLYKIIWNRLPDANWNVANAKVQLDDPIWVKDNMRQQDSSDFCRILLQALRDETESLDQDFVRDCFYDKTVCCSK